MRKLFTDLPTHWEICSSCEGEGTSSAYLGSFTQEDFDEDPDFAEDYMSGQYDRACPECNGSGKVKVVDYDRLTAEQRAEYDAECEYQAELAVERRMRERGIQF